MIFVGKKRLGMKALGGDWVAVGDTHIFVGDPLSGFKAPCGTRIDLRQNELPTLTIPPSHVERALYQFLASTGRCCSDCVWWLRNNLESLIAAEKIGEGER